ncbi:hypothetical protein C7M84_017407 [Penaeus vannamei]|uniref:Uncharacterized protein n=1 Tax=Penaeus vannamei TaxID=6689 RepID=A0A3R7LW28_PENVA|nr:hypothetical protein C7M84_017407 [Penaeus vannamei]
MDASNEFKVFLSPSSASAAKKPEGESSNIRQRLVPVINKVFSPSHFMLAQRKTTVYKAVSGVSFQDIELGGKRKSGTKREKKEKRSDKKDDIYTTASEGDKSQASGRSDKSGGGGHGSKAEARRHRHSLGSHAERPQSFLNDNLEKLSLDKKPRVRSASRTRSASATDNLYLSQAAGESNGQGDAPPIKPRRTRSASRPRKALSTVPVPSLTSTSSTSKASSSSGDGRSRQDQRKENGDKQSEKKSGRSNKSENSGERQEAEKDSKSKGELKAKEGEDEEPEGGYFSLEKEEKAAGEIKFIYEAVPTNSCEEYLENDQCVEAIYVCQVFRKDSDTEGDDDHVYENYQVIKMTKEGKLITDDDENYANYQIIRRVKEAELLGLPDAGDGGGEEDDLYESINFLSQNPLALVQTTATEARMKRRPRLGSSDSIPFIDDSDNSGDETVTRNPVARGVTPGGSVTVITIKDDDKTEITQKVAGPLRTKTSPLGAQDGPDAAEAEGKGVHGEKLAEASDRGRQTQSEARSKQKRSSEPSASGATTASSAGRGCHTAPSRHSYPAASSLIPKLADKVGPNATRLAPASEEAGGSVAGAKDGRQKKVKKSMSHSDVQSHFKGKSGLTLSESFSDDDIQHNEDFESFSETDSELDNLDYDMFTPKSSRSGQGSRPPLRRARRLPRGRSLSASHASPLMTSTPFGTCRNSSGSSAVESTVVLGEELQSPKTFQALLQDRCLNPPETDAESQAGDSKTDKGAPLLIRETGDVSVRGARDVVMSYHSVGAEAGDRVIVDDTLSFTWSDAESEFEFIDFKKAEPPKTKGSAVKRSHSMKGKPTDAALDAR